VNYHVVFDVSQNGSQLAIWFLIPLFALLPGLIGWALKNSGDPQSAFKGRFFILISGCGFAFSLVLLAGHWSNYHHAKKTLETRGYEIAEGAVRDFVPMPPGGHSIESFKVGDASFQYGSGWGSTIFNSEWNHGYIHNGAQVRITYSDGNILRVEVR
jgi:hypothetical protein